MALRQLGQQRLTSRLLQLPRSLWLVGGRPSDDRAFAIGSSEDKPESQDASTASKAQNTAGWATDGVKAAAHTVTRKAKEALGMEKPSAGPHSGESQEPAGAMESRESSGKHGQRYDNLVGQAKEQWKGQTASDLYPNAQGQAQATSEGTDEKKRKM